MSCCGRTRRQVSPVGMIPQQGNGTAVLFEYVGKSRLVIVGPSTRIAYRFEQPGARVLVDRRDRSSLASVAVLRQVGLRSATR